MASLARERLKKEYQAFGRNHPHGMWARLNKLADGSKDLFTWECGIPGPAGSPWEGATYRIYLKFSNDYPTRPPKCEFSPPLYHPNIFPSGAVCLSIINEDKDWRPTITVTQVLNGIQQLLSNPNPDDPAQREAVLQYRQDKAKYEEKVRVLARAYDASTYGTKS